MNKASSAQADAAPPFQSVSFQPIKRMRAHEYVAEQVRGHIGLGLIEVGDALPPERELMRLFGVGRGTIQGALRLLEADGLIETRQGGNGGTFLLAPLRDDAARERSLLELKLSRDQIRESLIFRRVVEEGAVRLAAEREDAGKTDPLRTILDRWDDARSDREFHRVDSEFHVGIAQLAESDRLRVSVEQARIALHDPLMAQPETDRWRDRIRQEHESILRAISAGNPNEAVSEMSKHLEHTEKSIDALIAALG